MARELKALRVTIEGDYIRNGAHPREGREYKEVFEIDPRHKDVEISHLIADGGPLKTRLAKRDIHYRGIRTHVVTSVEEIFEDVAAEEPEHVTAEPEL